MCYLCIVKHDNNSIVPPLVGTPGGLFRVLYKLRGGAEVARQSHNLEHVGSNPTPATMIVKLRVHSDLAYIENLDFLSRHAGIAWRLYFCSE